MTAKSERRARRLAWGLAAALAFGLAGISYFFVLERRQRDHAETARTDAEERRKEAVTIGENLESLKYAHQIALAQAEWQANNARNAWNHLESTDPRFRGWEYHYLNRLFSCNQITLPGHKPNEAIIAVAFRPDGKYLASAGRDKMVNVWDMATGKRHKSIDHTRPVDAVSFSPNGKFLATGGRGLDADRAGQWFGEVKLWDAQSFVQVKTLGRLADCDCRCLAFDPSSNLLAAGTDSRQGPGEVRVWDVSTGKSSRP